MRKETQKRKKSFTFFRDENVPEQQSEPIFDDYEQKLERFEEFSSTDEDEQESNYDEEQELERFEEFSSTDDEEFLDIKPKIEQNLSE